MGFDRESVLYTSSLARVLHDVQEDFEEFSIKLENPQDYSKQDSVVKYIASYKNIKNNERNSYRLFLTHKEAKLLTMQIDALSIPPEIKALENGDGKTKAQINHLSTKTKEIYELFGKDGFAAYQTLKIILDEKVDDVLTNYAFYNKFHSII